MKKLLFFVMVGGLLFASQHRYTNDLIYEESPYLRQHAHNPVHWLPWGKKAFEKAKKEHKPIFLSIGYSTCHWCHVMERESFENEEIAKLINEYYVPIKVDREERPDLDKYYQTLFTIMHRRGGGWPLTIIMTEERKPFFSATYIPPEDSYGVKGMKTILPLLAQAYKNRHSYIEQRADAVVKMVDDVLHQRYVPVQLDSSLASKALKEIKKEYDPLYGGFAKRIKFPQSAKIDLLLDIYLITKAKSALEMATNTLDHMAKGGIYDQIEGGFFRYATDREWTIPHFEKMLYTNAELIEVYTKAYKITKRPLYKRIVAQTIANIEKRFGHEGLYFSASNADSEGEEGKYFLYDFKETLKYLQKRGVKNPKEELAKLGITEDGNFDSIKSNPVRIAEPSSKTLQLLRKMRKMRTYPFIDKKIITAWNAMYIAAKLQASFIDDRYKKSALASLDKLVKTMYTKRLFHSKYLDNPPSIEGMLEDYAFLIKALLYGYEVSMDSRYLTMAKKLYSEAKKLFFKNGQWYFSRKDLHLVADIGDGYYSSALGTLAHDLLTLADLDENLTYFHDAKRILDEKSALIYNNPAYYPTMSDLALRITLGDVIIKHPHIEHFLVRLWNIHYPFLWWKRDKEGDFMACKVDTCFYETKKFSQLAKRIENLLQEKKNVGIWQRHEKR